MYLIRTTISLLYTGNRLKRVTDTALALNNGFEFTDGVHEAIEWEYDENGNLTKDLNKNITAIQYNCLNLPSRVMFANGNSISYLIFMMLRVGNSVPCTFWKETVLQRITAAMWSMKMEYLRFY